LRVSFNQFVAVLLPFFFCCLLAKQSKLLQEIGDLGLIATFPQCLDQVIERCLILGINLERFPALIDGVRILS
jgi:hypothetical protein